MHIVKTSLCLLTAALLATSSTLALAQTCNPNIPLTKPDSRYTYNAAGDEVTDTVTGLIWKRCAEGMIYSGGTCAGTAATFTWEGALAHAATQSGWRMPNLKELKSLVETACFEMALNQIVFPNTPRHAWSGTQYAQRSSNEVLVFNFYAGYFFKVFKGSNGSVRLVRGQ